MASYITNPHLQFVDEDGKPLAYGTIDTYIAGTTTPYATMKDFNGTMNPSTIVLDDDGSCTIIVPEDQLIKMVIWDRNGRLFKTYDNVGANGSGGSGGDYNGSDFISIDQIARVISLKNYKYITTDNTILMDETPYRITLKINPDLIGDESKDVVVEGSDDIDVDVDESEDKKTYTVNLGSGIYERFDSINEKFSDIHDIDSEQDSQIQDNKDAIDELSGKIDSIPNPSNFYNSESVPLSGSQVKSTRHSTGTTLKPGETFIGTIILSDVSSISGIVMFGFAAYLGDRELYYSNSFRRPEDRAWSACFPISVKNETNSDKVLEFGLHGDFNDQTLRVITSGIMM